MPGRKFNSDEYRFGFNGMESDDELKGTKNSYDFGARIYDPRLGRWLACDPKAQKYPNLSPYNFVANMPMCAIDPDGEDIVIIGSSSYQKQVISTINSLASNSGTGAQLVKDAIASGRTIVIVSTDSDIDNAVHGMNAAEYEVMTFNFDLANESYNAANGRNGEELQKTPETSLAHELFHFLSPQTGRLLDENGYATDILADEVNAVEVENQVRKEMDLEERTHYQGKNVHGKKIVESSKYANYYNLEDKEKYAPKSSKSQKDIDFSKTKTESEGRGIYYVGGKKIDSPNSVMKQEGTSKDQVRIYEKKNDK